MEQNTRHTHTNRQTQIQILDVQGLSIIADDALLHTQRDKEHGI